VLPLGDAIGSYLVRNYVVVDMVLVAARLVEGLGGDPAQILPGADNIEATVSRLGDIEAVREYARSLLGAALAYRDGQAGRYHGAMIRQARRYIETHYTDPELSLSEVAAHVNHSAGHFSAVFGQETGVTFKQFLTDLRIRRARELLRTTAARSSEIAAQVGYADPHYFSFVFHRETGLTPTAFRAQTPADPEPGGEIA
jgi:two-component system response regulator YesN